MAGYKPQKSLEETSTWAVAVVCFILLFISIVLEHSLHKLGEWFKKKHKKTLFEALEKVKAELMLLGFISLLLTIAQTPISQICINKNVASTMHPCSLEQAAAKKVKKPPKYIDTCGAGKVAFVSAYGIHQLHIFIFVLAVVHVIYCIVTCALGKSKMKIWKTWEEETKTIEYQYTNDPQRIRFARDTTFGRRHLSFWSKNSVTLWIVCFFRQFFGSVTKVDYLALRHGFIMAHMPTGNEAKYDFRKYIQRSLEKDFKTVVEISPVIWCVAVLFLLTNAHGLYSYLWLPFIPLVVLLIVGTKLEVTITKLAVRIQERGDVVRGAPVVQPGDDLFWFDKPEFILFLIHLVLFTNAFQLAFFVWSTYEFKLKNCFHERTEDVVIRIVVGVVVQILCSYVTLPLYALVTQMGSKMKAEVFDERVATALKHWHDTAKSGTKHGRHTESNTPFSSRPNTPPHGSSPIHLLHNFKHRSGESSNHQSWDPESQHQEEAGTSSHHSLSHASSEPEPVLQSVELGPTKSSKSLKDFSFK